MSCAGSSGGVVWARGCRADSGVEDDGADGSRAACGEAAN